MDSMKYDTISSQEDLFVDAEDVANPFFEIWRVGSEHVLREGFLKDGQVEAWTDQSGDFKIPSKLEGKVCYGGIRLIFGRPRQPVQQTSSGRIHDHGHFYPFALPFKRSTFSSLLDRCKLSRRILDLSKHRAIASHNSRFVLQDESSDPISIQSFLGLIRLHNDTAIITAYSYNANNGITTGIFLQTDEDEMKAIKEHIFHNTSFIGHELLLRTILTEMSLKLGMERLSEVKKDVMDIEHNTGQHTWHNYRPRRLGPLSDVELSREAHGLRIQTAVVCRRIEVASIWIELLLESLTKDQNDSANRASMLQWLQNMETEVKMAKLDVDFIAKRAENQVGAVYNRFAQRDNITSQKISEATNRESAAMKSLAVLGAIFFPGTYVAALFSLDSLKGVPFWMYWVITTPLTFIVLGIWAFWIYWRSESVKKQERKLDGKAIA